MKLKEKFQIIDQCLKNDVEKDVLRKIMLNLSSHEQTRQNQTDTLTDTSLDEISSFAISSVQINDLPLDDGSAFE